MLDQGNDAKSGQSCERIGYPTLPMKYNLHRDMVSISLLREYFSLNIFSFKRAKKLNIINT